MTREELHRQRLTAASPRRDELRHLQRVLGRRLAVLAYELEEDIGAPSVMLHDLEFLCRDIRDLLAALGKPQDGEDHSAPCS